jgi:hypothetical protein
MEISISLMGDIGRNALGMTSASASNVGLFEQYQELFKKKCEDAGVTTPFEFKDADKIGDFFSELSAEWKATKLKLADSGAIDKSKV